MTRRGRFKALSADADVAPDGAAPEAGGVPTIYVSTFSYRCQPGVVAFAVAEDGVVLRMRLEKNEYAVRRTFGFASHTTGHAAYRAHYPQGYRLEWVNRPSRHAGLRIAIEKSEHRLGR